MATQGLLLVLMAVSFGLMLFKGWRTIPTSVTFCIAPPVAFAAHFAVVRFGWDAALTCVVATGIATTAFSAVQAGVNERHGGWAAAFLNGLQSVMLFVGVSWALA